MLVQRPPLRVDHQPTLGQDLVFTLPEPQPAARETTTLHEASVLPTAPRADDDLTTAVWALVDEVYALRQDLRARSLEGRWRRFTGWVAGLWARLTGGGD